MKIIKLTITFLLMLTVVGLAQDSDVAKLQEPNAINSLGVKAAPSPFSLLDLSRIHFSQSYSMTYFSGGGNSGTMGLYTASMFYEFSPKLSLDLNVGIAHDYGAIWGDESSTAQLLPGFLLDYHPSDKFSISIGMQRYNGYTMPFQPYYRTFDRWHMMSSNR